MLRVPAQLVSAYADETASLVFSHLSLCSVPPLLWVPAQLVSAYVEDTASFVFSHLSLFSSPDAVGASSTSICLC